MATEVLPDDEALREARRRRALETMEAHGIDVLVLGREANARYVAGAPRLWTAGTRPFGPGCVIVRSTRAVHLVTSWDEGVPEDIPHENLFGITWNPGNLLAWLRGIEGVADAKRVGTDSLTPRFAQLLPKVFASAELIDAEPALEAARQVKAPEEVAAIRAAVAVAETALAAAVAELRPGVSEHQLAGVFMEAMARAGVTTPATQQVAWITPGPPSRGGRRSKIAHPGDLVAFEAGVVAAGYTGEVGRTWPVGTTAVGDPIRDLYRRANHLWHRLLEACRPGAPCSDLLAAYEAAGEALPPFAIASGLGLGFDLPVVTRDLPATAAEEQLVPGTVLAVTAYVTDDSPHAVLRRDAVLVTDGGADVLTSAPHWSS
ncbi:MAG TPA: M24 family metallopeptidase [Acidimicrobiales bacterium]|nr:M24 family metallopeptidase [Acidimicrobiales bacterium]